MDAWYTLHSKPGAERQVAAALEERGIATYLPEIKAQKDHSRSRWEPVFPNYLFCRVDFETVALTRLQWTPGLRRVVALDGQPTPVPEAVIDMLRTQLDHLKANGGLPSHPFQPGDPVRIVEGPFKDMLAIFDGPTTPTQRVQVLLDFLGKANRVQLEVSNLVKAAATGPAQRTKRPRRTRGRGRRIRQ